MTLAFALYVFAFVTGGINDGAGRYADDPAIGSSASEIFGAEPDFLSEQGAKVWI